MRASSDPYDSPFTEPDESESENEKRTDEGALSGPPRSPVEESFYESYLIQSRTAVDNLYASNVLSCQKHVKEVRDLARQRKVKLSFLEREERKLIKSMEALKLKQEAVKLTKPPHNTPSELNRKDMRITDKGREITRKERKFGSLPSLTTSSEMEDTENVGGGSKEAQSSVRFGLTESILSLSCNDLRSIPRDQSTNPDTSFVLPTIPNGVRPARSLENLSLLEPHFPTHIFLQVPNDPHANRRLSSRKYKTARSQGTRPRPLNWNKSQFVSDISTKVKWVPRT